MTDLSDPRLPGGGVGKQVSLGGVLRSDGIPSGSVVAELRPISGTVEFADVFFNGSADLPADPTITANVLADIVRITGFAVGKKRCRVTYIPLEDLGIPFAIGARAVINSPDITDASVKLTITDNTGGDTVNPIEGAVPQTVCKQRPVIEWDLTGTDYDIDDVYLVGIAPDGTGAKNVLLTIEVW